MSAGSLVGTYSSNTTVNVSSYGATSASQFVLVPSSANSTSNHQTPNTNQYLGHYYNGVSVSIGSLRLSGTTLTVTLPTATGTSSCINASGGTFASGSASVSIPCKVYYIG